MFELAQVYSLSGLNERAIETGLELLHRKPAHADVFKLLLNLSVRQPSSDVLQEILNIYSGPKSGELAREVSHRLSSAALQLLLRGQQDHAISLAKLAVRWSPAALEPKLALVEATSVLNMQNAGRPLDQYILGFFVDLAELFRLWRGHTNRTPFFSLSLLKSWTAFLDGHDSQIEEIFARLRGELLSQLGWESQSQDLSDKWEMKILLSALMSNRRQSAAETGWEDALLRLLSLPRESSNSLTVFSCAECSELHRNFRWKCSACQQWDTLIRWDGHPAQP
jgi:hypothetical protein